MRDKILTLISLKPKHFSKIISNTIELKEWVLANKLISDQSFAAEIYSAVYQVSNVCSNGNIKKFKSITEGFKGCGAARSCQCVKEQTSAAVTLAYQNKSIDEKETAKTKRAATNLEKYGVTNAGQTVDAKQKFVEWYANPENVQRNLERIKQTNIEKYGVENCKSLPEVEQKIIATCLARYNVTNVAQIPSTKAKLKARTAEYKLNGHLINKGYDRFKTHILDTYNCELLTSKEDYLGVTQLKDITVKCLDCNTVSTSNFYYTKSYVCQCHATIPSYCSAEEIEVFNFITQELNIAGQQCNKKIIAPYELDMVFPAHNIAIEYCGLYWHSESSGNKNRKYHYAKMMLAREKGLQLITIFSDEWNTKKDIVKSKLRNIFKQTSSKHYARKLLLKEVSHADSKVFLNLHHLQGHSNAKINLGLYNNTELVALMTFSNGRVALNTASVDSEYELVRFVTNGSSVVGGASKLLKHFIKTYKPTKIISYADNRWSVGNVYNTIGFTPVGTPAIGYWYIEHYTTRHHRFNFTKQALVAAGNDHSKSEWEIMQYLGFDRIWDCGHQKFELNIQ